MNKSTETGWWIAHLWVLALGVAVVALTAMIDASSILALAVALCCAVIVQTSLSRLARAYVAYVILGLVVAPLFAVIPNVNLDRTQFLASLWILAACGGGVVSSRTSRSSPGFRTALHRQSVTPAVFLAVLSLLVEYALIARGSFGIAGQFATGDSGNGYLGLLVNIGPPSAAGALLATLGRPTRTTRDLFVPAALVALQAVALTFSGFRGAAPLYVIAVALCSFRPAGSKLAAPLGKRVIVAAALIFFVVALFLQGASVRQSVAMAAGSSAPQISLSNTLPIVVQRFDESTYIAAADESRDLPAVKAAVSVSRQLRAIVPRFLYPSKGTIDYGRQVSIAVYGAPSNTVNFSTVTSLGDAMINFGLPGGLILVAFYVFLVDAVFRRTRRAATVRGMSVRVAMVMTALNLESPAVLSLISILRVSITIVAAHWLVALALTPIADRRRDVADRARPSARLESTTRHTTQLDPPAQSGPARPGLSLPSEARS